MSELATALLASAVEIQLLVILILAIAVLIPLEILARLINTKNKKNPLYWIDRFCTVTVRVFWERVKALRP